MIEYRCPACRAWQGAADEWVGMLAPCSRCHALMAIPLPAAPPWAHGISVGLLIVGGVCGGFSALFLLGSRTDAGATSCLVGIVVGIVWVALAAVIECLLGLHVLLRAGFIMAARAAGKVAPCPGSESTALKSPGT